VIPGTHSSSETESALIGLFSQHSAHVVAGSDGPRLIAEALDFPQSEYARHTQKPTFYEPYRKIREIRLRVDDIANTYIGDTTSQFRKSISLLKRYRRQNAVTRIHIARILIESALTPAWDEVCKQEFRNIADFCERR